MPSGTELFQAGIIEVEQREKTVLFLQGSTQHFH